MPGKSTAFSDTFVQPDGSFTMRSHPLPINYQDADGAWKKIDSRLVEDEGSKFAVRNAANDFTLRLPENPASTPVRFRHDGATVTSRLLGMRPVPVQAANRKGAARYALPAQAAAGRGASRGGALDLQVTATGLKETVVVREAPSSQPRYEYALSVSAGVTPTLRGERVVFTRADGQGGTEKVFEIPEPVMADSRTTDNGDGVQVPDEAFSSDIAVELQKRPGNDRWLYTVTPDLEWMQAPARVFPIKVDPSIQVGASNDCWIIQGGRNPHCAVDNLFTRAGVNANGKKLRGLQKFDISEIPSGAFVTGAQLRMKVNENFSGDTSGTNYVLQRVGQPWGGNGPDWFSAGDGFRDWDVVGGNPIGNARGAVSITGTETASGDPDDGDPDGAYVTFGGLAPFVQKWLDGDDNDGLMIRAQREGAAADTQVVFFYSASVQNGSGVNGGYDRWPAFEVSYIEQLTFQDWGDHDFWTFSEHELTDQMTAKINVGNGNVLLDTVDAQVAGNAGFDMVLRRYYNSEARLYGEPGWGAGWSSSLGGSIKLFIRDNGNVDFFNASLARSQFTDNGDGSFDRKEPGLDADLSFDESSSEYTLEWFSGETWVFDSDGRLQTQTDTNGNRLRHVYQSVDDGSGTGTQVTRLAFVEDTRGRYLRLTYNGSGQVETATIYRGSGTTAQDLLMEFTYEYNTTVSPVRLTASSLTRVGDALAGTAAATGTQSGTGGDDENIGARTEYSYNDFGQLIEVRDAREVENGDGGVTRIGYSGGNRGTSLTRVNDDQGTPDSVWKLEYVGDPFDDVKDIENDGQGLSQVCKDDDIGSNNGNIGDPSARTRLNGPLDDGQDGQSSDDTKYCIDNYDRVLRTTDAVGNERSQSFTGNSNVREADMTGTGAGTSTYEFGYDSDQQGGPAQAEDMTSSTSPMGASSTVDYDDTDTGADRKNPGNEHSPTGVSGADTADDDNRWSYEYDDKDNIIVARGRDLTDPQSGATTPATEYRYCWTGLGQIYRIDPVDGEDDGTEASHSTDPMRDLSSDPTNDARCDAAAGQGNDTLFSYNGDGELTGVDKPAGGDQSMTYDALSRLATVTDGRGVRTCFTYDAYGRTVQSDFLRDPAPGNDGCNDTTTGVPEQSIGWDYDLAGNRESIEDANGTNTFEYDSLNRLTSETGQGPSAQTDYDYDLVGNLTSSEVASEPGPVTYTYDARYRLSTMTDQRGAQAGTYTFNHDKKDNLARIKFPVDGGGEDILWQARYDDDGNPLCVYTVRAGRNIDTSQNDDDDSNDYDLCPNRTEQQPWGDESLDRWITYTGFDYDDTATGRQTASKQKTYQQDGLVTEYDYDTIHRLSAAVTEQDGSTTVRDFAYTYDHHSNLVTETVTADSGAATPGLETGKMWSVHNGGDEICAAIRTNAGASDPGLSCGGAGANPSSATIYAHDAAGNMLTATGGTKALLGGSGGTAGNSGGASFTYNLPGQTATIDAPGTGPGQGDRTQAYDGVMQDRRTTDGPTAMSYGFPAGVTSQDTTADPVEGTHAELFVRTPDGRLLAMLDYTGGSINTAGSRYYLLDDMKTVEATIPAATPGSSAAGGDANPDAVRYAYEPYGQTIRTWVDPAPGTTGDAYSEDQASTPPEDFNPFGYVSGYTDKATGLVKFGTRYYAPQLATWTQPDPKNGKLTDPLRLNGFVYAAMDPVTQADPLGRDWYDAVKTGLGYLGKASEFYDGYQFVRAIQLGNWESAAGVVVGSAVGGGGAAICTAAIVGAPIAGAIGCGLYFSAVGFAAEYGTTRALEEGF